MSVHIDQAAIDAMAADPEGPVGKIIERFCYKVESVAKVLVQTPGSGRYYPPGQYFLNRGGKIYHWVRTTGHVASAPGEPPASDTGMLLNSIGHELTVENVVVGRVYARVKYAKYLEFGTRFMEPRPFLRPALHAGVKG